MGTANLRKEVIGSIRDMRAEREQALADYVDTLIRAATAEQDLADARAARDKARGLARDAGNTAAELERAARIIRAHTHHTGNQPEHDGEHADGDQPQDMSQHDGHDEHTENQPW